MRPSRAAAYRFVFNRDPDPIRQLRRRRDAAHRRLQGKIPFSPAWDAAMSRLEDAERELWRLETEGPEESLPPAGRRWAIAGTAHGW
jgi:hypothetical protein